MFTRIGDATDIVTKEMYDFVDKGGRHVALRPEQTASVCRAFVELRPPTPWKAWYSGPQLPLREAAARPLPAVRPGRDRGARRRRPVPRRRGDRPRLGVLPAARAATGRRCCVNSLGEPDDRARYVDALRSHFEARRRRALRAEPRDAQQEPAAGARLEAPRGRRDHRRRAHDRPVLVGRRGCPLRHGAGRARPTSASRSRSTCGSCAGSTTTVTRRSSSRAARSTPPRTRSAAAVATTASSKTSAVPPRPASASRSASTARCWRAATRACSPRPTTSVDVFVVDTTGGREALLITTELRAAGLAPTARSRTAA